MAELVSRGDIRILGGLGALNRDSSAVLTTQFATPGDLTLTAAQIYRDRRRRARGGGRGRARRPTGFRGRQPPRDPARRRSVAGHALQRLRHVAARGRHHRTGRRAARAARPAGDRRGEHQRHHLARDAAARQRHLRQRTRPDDALWRHRRRRRLSMAGAGRAPDRPGRREYHGSLSVGLQLAGQTVQVGDNALVDLSGGGQLLGAGFISGRGGSTDARFNPLVQTNPQGGFTLPGLSTNPVYALVPGAQPWPRRPRRTRARASRRSASRSPSAPACRLPAGTYADAVHLRPDARRLPRRDQRRDARPGRRRRAAAAQRFLGHRRPPGQCLGRHRRRRAAPVTDHSGQLLRQYSQYNEMDYAAFVAADATRRGQPRALAPADARTLRLLLAKDAPGESFSFAGRADFSAAGGNSGTLAVASMNSWQDALEITAPGAGRSAGFNGLSLDSAQLNRLGAPRLMVAPRRPWTTGTSATLSISATAPPTSRASRCARAPADGRRGVPGRRRALGQHRHRTRRIHQHRGTRRAGLRLVDRLHLQARPRQRGGGVQRLDQPAAARCRPAARRRGRHPHRRLRSRRLRGRGAALFGRHDRLRHQQGLRTGQRRPLRRAT